MARISTSVKSEAINVAAAVTGLVGQLQPFLIGFVGHVARRRALLAMAGLQADRLTLCPAFSFLTARIFGNIPRI
jgi:hypothetical protein